MQSKRSTFKNFFCDTCKKIVTILVNTTALSPLIKCPHCQGNKLEMPLVLPKYVPKLHPMFNHPNPTIDIEKPLSINKIVPHPHPSLPKSNPHNNKHIIKPMKKPFSPPKSGNHPVNTSYHPKPDATKISAPKSQNLDDSLLQAYYQEMEFNKADQKEQSENLLSNELNFEEYYGGHYMEDVPNIPSLNFGFEDFGDLQDPIPFIVEEEKKETDYHALSKKAINSIKKFKLQTTNCKKNSKGETELASCSICCDKMKVGDTVAALPCTHMYHYACINPWFSTHNICPFCRKSME